LRAVGPFRERNLRGTTPLRGWGRIPSAYFEDFRYASTQHPSPLRPLPPRFRLSPKRQGAPPHRPLPTALPDPYPCRKPPAGRAWLAEAAAVRNYLRFAGWSFAQP